jgi:hypothetical protein
MDENLVGYLLEALDPDERRAVDARLRDDPEARARLEALRPLLAPLAADADPPEPPPGLALATLARVAEYARGGLPKAPQPSRRQVGAPRRGLRLADLAVAAALLLLAGGLGLSWLARQRRDAQVLACQNNLFVYWGALQRYSDQHPDPGPSTVGGAFPQVEAHAPRNFAGVFLPVLATDGVLGDDVSVGCPALGRRPPPRYTLQELDEMAHQCPGEFKAAAREFSGDYAYSLGYVQNDILYGLRRDSGDYLPILADRPPAAGAGNSPNHGGGGQNVLYIGGQVRWCVDRGAGVDRDDIYLNQKYQLLAGENRLDTVLGPSDASPYPRAD